VLERGLEPLCPKANGSQPLLSAKKFQHSSVSNETTRDEEW
jgi:hypothetical protein